jgi:hypothetical protein
MLLTSSLFASNFNEALIKRKRSGTDAGARPGPRTP